MKATAELGVRRSSPIEQLEIARELGQTDRALDGFCKLRSNAAEKGDIEAVGLATAHIVVCYKHIYEKSGDQEYCRKIENELKEALALPLSKDLKAVFLMRYSGIESDRKNFEQAESYAEQAYCLVSKNDQAEVECLSKLAYAKTMLGKLPEAETLFARAAEIVSQTQPRKSFQRVSVESGLLARRARLNLAQGRYAHAIVHFFRGYLLAWEYKVRYGMPQRLKQYHRVWDIEGAQSRTLTCFRENFGRRPPDRSDGPRSSARSDASERSDGEAV